MLALAVAVAQVEQLVQELMDRLALRVAQRRSAPGYQSLVDHQAAEALVAAPSQAVLALERRRATRHHRLLLGKVVLVD